MRGFRKPTKNEIIENQNEVITELIKIVNAQKALIDKMELKE